MDNSNEPDHRGFLYLGIGWMLMDLRQDIEFHHFFMEGEYPVEQVIERLAFMQGEAAEYADKHFPVSGRAEYKPKVSEF